MPTLVRPESLCPSPFVDPDLAGTAGYGDDNSSAIGHSYATEPLLTPILYDPVAPAGQRWSRDGLGASTVPRMYHSTATLLVDGRRVQFFPSH